MKDWRNLMPCLRAARFNHSMARTMDDTGEGVEAEEIDDGDTPLIEIRMYGIDAPEKARLCERANGVCYKCGQRSKGAVWLAYQEGGH